MMLSLDETEIFKRHPGMSQGVALAAVEAASVALARRHLSPTNIDVDDARRVCKFDLGWPGPSPRDLRAWRDDARATEWGAEAVAILCVDACRGMVVVERAMRGSRVDYYVGGPDDGLERAAALEIGGTQSDGVAGLLEEKRRQAAQNPDRLPALAVAVRFHDPRVMIADARRERA